MRTSATLFFRQSVAITLSVCLTSAGALAQKPKAPASPATGTPPAAAPATPAPQASANAAPKPLSEILVGQSKADYDAAKLLYEDGDFAGAGLKFKQAFDASKDVRLLWNMAACEKAQRHYSKVFKLVDRYLILGRPVLPEADQKDAAALLDAMKAFVSHVKIAVNEPEATISVDDEVVGVSPLMEPVLLDMGARRLRVTKPGYAEFVDTLQITGSAEVPVTVKLERDKHEGRIAVVTGADNLVYLDGKIVGQGRWDGTVASGSHTVRVTGQAMKSYQTEIVMADRETRSLDITLESETKKESGSGALWWLLGGVVVAGAATGGIVYLATRNNNDAAASGQGAIAGTIQPGSIQLSFRQRSPW